MQSKDDKSKLGQDREKREKERERIEQKRIDEEKEEDFTRRYDILH